MSNHQQKQKKIVKVSTKRNTIPEPKLDQVHENTEHVLLYCAHLETMLKKLQSDYDRLQERQEEIMSRLKGDQDAVVTSMQTLFADLSDSVQDLINSNNAQPHSGQPHRNSSIRERKFEKTERSTVNSTVPQRR